jgi:hypothetical protein
MSLHQSNNTSSKLLDKFYPVFKNIVNKSDISYPLVAGILYKNKLINNPCCNMSRNYCRGQICSSIHAECNACLNYYGKNLQFDRKKNRWCLLQGKYKKGKES